MTTIKLNGSEKELLTRILDEYFSELRMEISNTENWELKSDLKQEEKLILRLLSELKSKEK